MLKPMKSMKFLAALLTAITLLFAACGSETDDAVAAGVETNESTDETIAGDESDNDGSADADTTDGSTEDSTVDGTTEDSTVDGTEDGAMDDSTEDDSAADDGSDDSSMDDDGTAGSESQAVFTIGATSILFDVTTCTSPAESTVSFDGASETGTAISVEATDMAGVIAIDGPEGSWEGQVTSVVVGDIGNVTVNGTASVADDSSTTGPEDFEVTGFICA